MATTTATITLSSSDLTGDALSLSTTATLTKAGVTTGLDQTTGVARKFYATQQSNEGLILAADYTDDKAHKVYIKNTSTSRFLFSKEKFFLHEFNSVPHFHNQDRAALMTYS